MEQLQPSLGSLFPSVVEIGDWVEHNVKTKHIRLTCHVGVTNINTLVFPDAKITQNDIISNLWAM